MTNYVLPAALELHRSWHGCELESFVPSDNQKIVIAAVQAALAQGLYYTSDVLAFCKRRLALSAKDQEANFDRMRTEGGIFGMDCYYARNHLDAISRREKLKEIARMLQPQVGMSLGTLIFNDFKRSTNVRLLERVAANEWRMSLKRGKYDCTLVADVAAIKAGMDRAFEKKARKDNFADFVKSLNSPLTACAKASNDTLSMSLDFEEYPL